MLSEEINKQTSTEVFKASNSLQENVLKCERAFSHRSLVMRSSTCDLRKPCVSLYISICSSSRLCLINWPQPGWKNISRYPSQRLACLLDFKTVWYIVGQVQSLTKTDDCPNTYLISFVSNLRLMGSRNDWKLGSRLESGDPRIYRNLCVPSKVRYDCRSNLLCVKCPSFNIDEPPIH